MPVAASTSAKPTKPKELAPEVATAWTKLDKAITSAFASLPPISKDTVDLHRSLRVQLNKRQHEVYTAHSAAYPKA